MRHKKFFQIRISIKNPVSLLLPLLRHLPEKLIILLFKNSKHFSSFIIIFIPTSVYGHSYYWIWNESVSFPTSLLSLDNVGIMVYLTFMKNYVIYLVSRVSDRVFASLEVVPCLSQFSCELEMKCHQTHAKIIILVYNHDKKSEKNDKHQTNWHMS